MERPTPNRAWAAVLSADNPLAAPNNAAAPTKPQTKPQAAFEKLKSLAGDWEGKSTKGWTEKVTYAVISGGPRTTFEPSGTVWIIDLRTRTVVATVTGVGNDPYGLAVVEPR